MQFSFEEALQALRTGKRVRRPNWQHDWLHLEILVRGQIAEIYLVTAVGMEWPYHAPCRTDLLASDWEIVS